MLLKQGQQLMKGMGLWKKSAELSQPMNYKGCFNIKMEIKEGA